MEFLVCNDIGTSEHVLSTKLEGYFGGVMGRVVHLGCAVTFSSFWGADLETTLPTKTALFIGTPFLYSP